jgi:hypothetical protein
MSRRILGGAAAVILGAMLLAPATASADHCRRYSRGYYGGGGYYSSYSYDPGYYGYRYSYAPRYYRPYYYTSYYYPGRYYGYYGPPRAYVYTRLRHRPRVSLHIGF